MLVYRTPSTISRSEIDRDTGKTADKRVERVVARHVSLEIGRKTMARKTTFEYEQGLSRLKNYIAAALAMSVEADTHKPVVDVEQGRKYDKVRVFWLNGNKVSKPELRFFVEQATGNIYGVKSPVAPNLNQYFGTVQTAEHWEWESKFPTPKDEEKAGVVCIGAYGDASHYVPKGSKVKADGRTKTGKKYLVTVEG